MYKVVQGPALTGEKLDPQIGSSGNLGVYVICHGNGRRPVIFSAQGTSNRAREDCWMEDGAKALRKLFQALGVTRIRKLSILMCGTSDARGLGEGDPLFVTVLGRTLRATIPGEVGVTGDFVIAGYDDYVSVVSGDDPDAGRKKVGQSKVLAKGSDENKLHKRTYWVTGNGTMRMKPGWSGPGQWSDSGQF